jgi:hypothetical protein
MTKGSRGLARLAPSSIGWAVDIRTSSSFEFVLREIFK